MKLAGISTLVRKFFRETWAFGLLSAARKSIKGVGNRSGLASTEQFDVLAKVVETLSAEVSLRRQEEARLRQQMDALQATTASAIQTLEDETSALRHENATLREQLNAIQETIAGVRATLAEMLVNRPHAEVADLMRRAGIHLHTHSLQEPYGMPVSIAESMAAGCYVIARRSPASASFVAEAGETYDTEAEAAALVHETETWTSSQWAAARLASTERAFAHYASSQVLRPLLEEWTTPAFGSFTATA